MSKKYYKVVFNSISNELLSVSLSNYVCFNKYVREHLGISYKINEWVKPKDPATNLMCFDNLNSARTFIIDLIDIKYEHQLKIFECKVKNPRKNGLYFKLHSNYESINDYIQHIKELKLYKKKKYSHLYRKCPYDNTVFCSAIKLIQEVK